MDRRLWTGEPEDELVQPRALVVLAPRVKHFHFSTSTTEGDRFSGVFAVANGFRLSTFPCKLVPTRSPLVQRAGTTTRQRRTLYNAGRGALRRMLVAGNAAREREEEFLKCWSRSPSAAVLLLPPTPDRSARIYCEHRRYPVRATLWMQNRQATDPSPPLCGASEPPGPSKVGLGGPC